MRRIPPNLRRASLSLCLCGLTILFLCVCGTADAQDRNWPSEGPPRPLAARDIKFPPYELQTLSNGLQVVAGDVEAIFEQRSHLGASHQGLESAWAGAMPDGQGGDEADEDQRPQEERAVDGVDHHLLGFEVVTFGAEQERQQAEAGEDPGEERAESP